MTRATAGVWLLLGLHGALVTRQAWLELHDSYEIQGLFRMYRPPRLTAEGWLIDPRPGDLAAEIAERYGPAGADGAPPPTLDGWQGWLGEHGFATAFATGFGGPEDPPRLVFLPGDRVVLQTGRFRGQAVLFDPAQGVLLLAEGLEDAEAQAIVLVSAREPPW
ncbi:MAG: hypothetical protein KC549_18625 [Myxococcales bacterium]|nr:hypothetical protein [Myxococcales bacterium]MCB9547305.1 hypothetical protein [Myxococcales bacterium]